MYPATIDIADLAAVKPEVPFADSSVCFLADLSTSLLADRQVRQYPDVATFAYFIRRANLLKLKEAYTPAGALRLGRGLVFHVAPSNVPVNFAYSFVAGLLAGNANIVRLPSKDFPQVDILLRHIGSVVSRPEHCSIARANAFVRYPRTSDATALFSAHAAVRVIWGGDDTIAAIRRHPLPPRAFDVCFADRYSIALLDSAAVLAASDTELARLAGDFYNDTYLFDQNACSAPHLLLWTAHPACEEAKSRFWTAVHALVKKRYKMQDILAVDKLTALCSQAIDMEIERRPMPDNMAVRVELKQLSPDIDRYRCAGGYFAEYTVADLAEILPIISPRYQTLAYYGINPQQLRTFVAKNRPIGIDRIVPVGHTTDFSLTWDGYNLVDTLSRSVRVLPL